MSIENKTNGLQEDSGKMNPSGYSLYSQCRCQHCYCGCGIWNGQEHLVCCICGHRTLKNPITF